MYWENEGVNILGVDLILMHRMILLLRIAYSKGKKIHFKMRSQDVLHSAYMPILERK
jgi:cytochrome c oxidase subunit 2